MKIIILFFASLPLFAASTNFDLNGGLQGRTIPALGAELYAEGGYNQLLWGEKKTPKDFLYGLIRPNLGVSSSAVINSAKAEIEVFPISILGFSAGRQTINSNYDFKFLDCDTVACQGSYSRDWVESKMVVGAKGWVLMGNFKVDSMRGPTGGRPMADWRNAIIGNAGHDVQIEKKLLFGRQFGQNLAGILIENVRFEGSGQRKESFAAVYQQRRGDTNYLIGAGGFHSDVQPMALIFYFRIHHIALPSLKLF